MGLNEAVDSAGFGAIGIDGNQGRSRVDAGPRARSPVQRRGDLAHDLPHSAGKPSTPQLCGPSLAAGRPAVVPPALTAPAYVVVVDKRERGQRIVRRSIAFFVVPSLILLLLLLNLGWEIFKENWGPVPTQQVPYDVDDVHSGTPGRNRASRQSPLASRSPEGHKSRAFGPAWRERVSDRPWNRQPD